MEMVRLDIFLSIAQHLSSREIQTAKTQNHKIKCKKPRPESKILSFYFYWVFAACVIISGKFPDIVPKIDLNEQPEVLLRIKNDAI